MKLCTKCGAEKELKNFYKSTPYKDGFNPWCKECHRQNSRASYVPPRPDPSKWQGPLGRGMKRCSRCCNEKSLAEFYRQGNKHSAWCKDCRIAWEKHRRLARGQGVGQTNKWKTLGSDGLRECSKCKERKSPTEFYTDKRAHDGLKHQCKKCHEGYTKAWDERNPKKRAEMNRKSMRSENHVKATARWRANNKERHYAMHLAWVAANPDRWQDLQRQNHRKRRARKRGAEGSYTEKEVRELYEKQRGKCAMPWCHASLKAGFHRDHITSLSAGGSNFIENIQLLCPTCNMKKHVKDPVEFAQANGYLI